MGIEVRTRIQTAGKDGVKRYGNDQKIIYNTEACGHHDQEKRQRVPDHLEDR